MSKPLRVLVVEDSEDDALLIARALRGGGYHLTTERVDTPETMSAALAEQKWDVVIADYSMPRFDGLAALKLCQSTRLDLPFIIVSGTIGEERAVAVMKAGAHDYVMKHNLARLVPAVDRELLEARTRVARRRAEKLLVALNRAALAMEKALTVEKIFAAAAAELEQIGLSCMVLPLDESQNRLLTGYLGLNPTPVRAAEKLVGLEHQDFSFPVEKADVYRRVVKGKETVLITEPEEVMKQVVPEPAKRFTARPVRMVDFATAIAAPLIVGDEVLGVLSVKADDLTEDDIPAITAFAHQVAAAWRKAQLFEQAQQELAERRRAEEALWQRTAQLEALQQLGLELTAQLALDTLLHSIVSRAIELLDGTSGGLWLYRPEQDVLEWSIGIGPHLPPLGTRLHLGESLCGKVWETGEPLIVNDYWHWEGRSRLFDALANVATVGALVRWGDESLGVLNVLAEVPHTFTSDDAELLSLFATQAAIAIRNARLYEAASSRAERLAVVNHIASAVGATLHLDDLLETVYQEITTIFLADAFFIALYDEETHELEYRIQVDQGARQPPERQPMDTGLTSLVVTEKHPLLIRDLKREQVRLPEPMLWGTMELPASWLGVPMQIGERLVGIICVQSYRSYAYSSEDQQLLSTIADQVALAVERARLYQTLHDSEERYRTLFEQANDAVFVETLQGQILDVNERACQLLGYEREEFLSLTMADVVPVRVQEMLSELTQERAAAGGWHIETETRCKDGSQVSVEISATLLEVGGQDLVLALVRDVTERKYAEREIEERRRYLEGVLAAAPDAIVTLDASSRVVEWNRGAERLFGYLHEEVIGQDLDHLINAPGTFEEAVGLTQTAMRGEAVPPREAVRYRKDGSPVDLILAGSPILVEGRLIGVVAVYTDISKRKRSERLLQALNQAAAATEQALTPEEVFTTSGEEFKKLGISCTIFFVDDDRSMLLPRYYSYDSKAVKAAEKLLGLKAEHFSMPIEKIDVLKEAVQEEHTVFADGEKVIRQLLSGLLRRASRQVVKILRVGRAINAPLIVEDEVIGLLSVQSDDLTIEDMPAITAFAHQMAAAWHKAHLMQDLEVSLNELKRTQSQLFQSQKMEALGRLAGGIAHDFNNLLTVIDISTRLLERQLHPQDPLWEHVRRIQETGKRAADLTKQLLSFSRREIIEPRVVNLNELIGDLSGMLQRIIGEDIKLMTALTKDLWNVKVDPPQMEQVIVNLAVNARDAMPQGGNLSIQTANVVLDETYVAQYVDAQLGEHVMLTTSDTGMGMSDEVKEHLFEPFFTTKERGQGTGLGLPIVFGFVKQSGGHIRVSSAVGQGTTFHIYLPRTREPATQSPSRSVANSTVQGTETVLVVEDETAVRNLAVTILTTHGYQVLAAADGYEAIEFSKRYNDPIHLLLTDVVMPQMSGKELAEQLQSQRRELRVLYMSGYSSDVIAYHGVPDEGIVILPKPFTLEALAHKVRGVLDAPM